MTPEEEDEDKREREVAWAELALVASVIATFVLYRLPHAREIAYPLMLLSTLAHEAGHGIGAWLVGGHFHSLLINADGSGVATNSGYAATGLPRAFVSAGGLVGPACFAALLFALARRPRLARASLLATAAALAVSLPILIEGTFGKVFVSILAAFCAIVGARAPGSLCRYVIAFGAVQLALSVYSRGDYLFEEVAHTMKGDFPSDSANMASSLFGPYWLWGAVCGAFSIVVVVLGVYVFTRGFPWGKKVAAPSAAPPTAPVESPSDALARLRAGSTRKGPASERRGT